MRVFFTTFCLLLSLIYLEAQSPLKTSEINAKIKAIGNDESKKAEKKEWETLLQLRKARESAKQETETKKNASKALEEDKQPSLKPIEVKDLNIPLPDATYAQLTERVAAINQQLDTLVAQQKKLSDLLSNNQQRLKAIPAETDKLTAELTALKITPEGQSAIESHIQKERKAKLQAKIDLNGAEQKFLELKIPSLKTNLKTLESDILKVQPILATWSNKLTEANLSQASTLKKQIVEISTKLKENSPATVIAKKSTAIAENLLVQDSVQTQLSQTRAALTRLNKNYILLTNQQEYAEERIKLLENAGLSIDRETGKLLRKQRGEIPTEEDLRARLKQLLSASTENELALLDLNESQSMLPSNLEQSYAALSNSQQNQLSSEEWVKLNKAAKKLHDIAIKERKDLAKEQKKLTTLLQTNIHSTEKYSRFIDSRLLWIVSHPPLNGQAFVEEMKSIQSLFSPTRLLGFLTSLQQDFIESPVSWLFPLLLLLTLLSLRKKLHTWASASHDKASDPNCNTFTPTINGFFCAICLSLPLPLTLYIFGSHSPSSSPYHSALLTGAAIYFIFGFLRRLLRVNGFFAANGLVNTGHLRLYRKVIRPLYFTLPPLVILNTALIALPADLTQGRIITILTLLIIAYAMHYILVPYKRVISGQKNPGALCYIAYTFFVIFPVVLVIGTIIGYYLSTLLLRSQYIYTVRLTLIVLVIAGLLVRWLLVSRRRALVANAAEMAEPTDTRSEQELAKEHKETVTKLSDQSYRLIKLASIFVLIFSLIGIWSKTLPALSILDKIELWQTTKTEATTENASPAGSLNNPMAKPASADSNTEEEEPAPQKEQHYISLQDLFLFLIILILTYLGSTNIPSLLQITILNHLSLKSGTGFALTTIIRYTIIIVGIIWAFSSIGVTWDKIQWLAAAISLGIGFGLQEIFANFVSGLILLFERPIRIGDLITVGDINGRVTKIQMRATTIHQFNNRELIVPNKEFITGQLVNWTLTDNLMRAEIYVGIAYGSDTQRAKELLIECGKENKRVLKTPVPNVIFKAFGGSSLDFHLRVFVSSVDDLIPVQSELHFAIDQAFREADIEISFPQQDIHIRSIEAALPITKGRPQES